MTSSAACAGRRGPWRSGTTASCCTCRSTTTTATAASCTASPWPAMSRPRLGRCRRTLRCRVSAGGELAPRRAALLEHQGVHRAARIVVERAARHADHAAIGRNRRHASAIAAKATLVARRGFVRRNLIGAGDPAEALRANLQVDAIEAARDLAAVGAKARDRERDARIVKLECYRAAEAGAPSHGGSP